MKYNCSVCNKETTIETFDGIYNPLCFHHYMDYLNSPEYILKTTVKEEISKLVDSLYDNKINGDATIGGLDEAVEQLKMKIYIGGY